MAEARISQAATLIELTPQGVRSSQAPALVEIDTVQLRTSQLLTLVELEPLPVRVVRARLEIDWAGTGDYVDETANLISARGETRLTAPGSALFSPRGAVDRMSVTLYNRPLDASDPASGRRYSPLNSASPLYAYIANGGAWQRPMRFSLSIDNGQNYTRIFTGVIRLPAESTPTPSVAATIDIDCRSSDDPLLQIRLSTLQSDLQSNFAAQPDEAALIGQLLAHPALSLSGERIRLDPGFFPIPCFWLDDESPLEELWQLAAAAGGRMYAAPDGVITYENIQHWLFHDQPVETLTRRHYQQLALAYDDKDLASVLIVEAAPRTVDGSATLWEPDESIQIPADGERTVTARLKQPAYTIDAIDYQAITLSGANLTADVTLSYIAYAQRVELTFTNANPTYAATLHGLAISGQPIVGAPTLEERATSLAPFWGTRTARHRTLRGNPYIQRRAQAQALAEHLRDSQQTPRLTYTLTNLLGVPARRLGDRIRIEDPETMPAARDAYLTAISWSFGAQGYRQTLEATDAATLYPYARDAYLVLGADLLGVGKRIFY